MTERLAGVHRVDTRAAARRIAADARGARWRVVRVDGRRTTDKGALLAHLAERLSFAAWFGANWDALVDAVRDAAETPGVDGLCLVWDHADVLEDGDPDAAAQFAEIVADLAAEGSPLALVIRPG